MDESRMKRRIRHFLKKVFKTLTFESLLIKNKMAQNTIEYDNITDIDDIDVTDEYKQLQKQEQLMKRTMEVSLKSMMN